MNMTRRAGAEFFGTFWLTFGGCGSAVHGRRLSCVRDRLSRRCVCLRPDGADDGLRGRTHLGRPFQSCRHHRTVGRQTMQDHPTWFPMSSPRLSVPSFAAAVLYLIASGKAGWVPGGFAANGYGDLSPGKYNLTWCLLMEALMTFFFLVIIIGCTSKGAATWDFRRDPDRSRPDADPPGVDPCHQYLGQSRPQHGARILRRRRVCWPALAVLACADHRRCHRRPGHALAARGSRHRVGRTQPVIRAPGPSTRKALASRSTLTRRVSTSLGCGGNLFRTHRCDLRLCATRLHRTSPAGDAGSDARRCLPLRGSSANRPTVRGDVEMMPDRSMCFTS